MIKDVKEHKITLREVFTIPNILSYIRLLLIPLFIYSYINAEDEKDYLMAGAVIFISGITDICDGYIARKFNQVTELGKLIDPVADKLTQAAIIIILMFRIRFMIFFIVLFAVKEITMIINGIILFKKGKQLDGAMWFGKVSTAVFYASSVIIILFPMIKIIAAEILMMVSAIFMGISFVLYMKEYLSVFKDMH